MKIKLLSAFALALVMGVSCDQKSDQDDKIKALAVGKQ